MAAVPFQVKITFAPVIDGSHPIPEKSAVPATCLDDFIDMIAIDALEHVHLEFDPRGLNAQWNH
jgi:hypothetical protein